MLREKMSLSSFSAKDMIVPELLYVQWLVKRGIAFSRGFFSVSVPNSQSWLLKGRNYILNQNMFRNDKMKSFNFCL